MRNDKMNIITVQFLQKLIHTANTQGSTQGSTQAFRLKPTVRQLKSQTHY